VLDQSLIKELVAEKFSRQRIDLVQRAGRRRGALRTSGERVAVITLTSTLHVVVAPD
jgi:hypothetical protein